MRVSIHMKRGRKLIQKGTATIEKAEELLIKSGFNVGEILLTKRQLEDGLTVSGLKFGNHGLHLLIKPLHG